MRIVNVGLLLIFTTSACSVMFPDRTAPKSANYKITPPTPPWHRYSTEEENQEPLRADVAFENSKTGANFSLNSLCRKYHETSLDVLTESLVRGIEDRVAISSKSIVVNDVDALDSTFEGKVDKVLVRIRTIVLVKDSCTFDFIYVAIPSREENSHDDFEKFVRSFRVES